MWDAALVWHHRDCVIIIDHGIIHVLSHVHTPTYAYRYTCTCTYTYTYKYIHIHKNIHIHIYIHTHTCIHIHTGLHAVDYFGGVIANSMSDVELGGIGKDSVLIVKIKHDSKLVPNSDAHFQVNTIVYMCMSLCMHVCMYACLNMWLHFQLTYAASHHITSHYITLPLGCGVIHNHQWSTSHSCTHTVITSMWQYCRRVQRCWHACHHHITG